MNQLEQIGALYLETKRLIAEYASLLSLVERLIAGEVDPRTVRVDEKTLSWSLVLGDEQQPDDKPI